MYLFVGCRYQLRNVRVMYVKGEAGIDHTLTLDNREDWLAAADPSVNYTWRDKGRPESGVPSADTCTQTAHGCVHAMERCRGCG